MALHTSIEWTDWTWNLGGGCTEVGPDCANCYAKRLIATRLKHQPRYRGLASMVNGKPRWSNEVRFFEDRLEQPLRHRLPSRIFVNALTDLFHPGYHDEEIAQAIATIALAHWHTFQLLTKHPDRMRGLFSSQLFRELVNPFVEELAFKLTDPHNRRTDDLRATAPDVLDDEDWPLPNLHCGTSAGNQDCLEERLPHLLRTPATLRFLSLEPLLGLIDLTGHLYGRAQPCDGCPKDADCSCGFSTRGALGEPAIDWVIVGGESGDRARPCAVEWIRSIVAQCRDARVPVFVKQLGSQAYDENGNDIGLGDRKGGEMSEWPEDLRIREFPHVETVS